MLLTKQVCAIVRDVAEQAFHAHSLAEQAYSAATGTKPPSDEHIQHSKDEIMSRLQQVIELLGG